MSMRITAGKAGGLRLSSFPAKIIRPTRDIVREAVFNSIGEKIIGKYFLDLFSGTGGVGIEALSRGAEKAVFIEKNVKALSVIKKNLKITGLESNAVILCDDYERVLKKLNKGKSAFDIIYCDPPYASDYHDKCLSEAGNGTLLSADGLFVLETFKKNSFPEKAGQLQLAREKLYGETRILYYRQINS